MLANMSIPCTGQQRSGKKKSATLALISMPYEMLISSIFFQLMCYVFVFFYLFLIMFFMCVESGELFLFQ